MSEESYELQLVGEGLNIISVPLLPRDTLEPPTDEADNNALVTNDEGSSVKTENTWINDMLANLKVGIIRNFILLNLIARTIFQDAGNHVMDFPVFCSDGIFWSNKLLLASIAPFIQDSLVEDSCLVVPDHTLSHMETYHKCLFDDRKISKSQAEGIYSVSSTFRTNSSLSSKHSEVNKRTSKPNILDYKEIFKTQREEYVEKMLGNTDIARFVVRKTVAQNNQIFPPDVMRDDQPRKMLSCDECNRLFELEESLKSHKQMVHNKENSMKKHHSCKYCPQKFSFAINVKRHEYLVHRNKINKADDQNTSVESSPTKATAESQVTDFKCNICGEYLKSKRYLVAHITGHYGGGYKCDYPGCSSVFKENNKLKRHKLVHTGEKSFECKHCGMFFSLRHNLKTHEKTHTRQDLLKCKYCDYETIQKSNMKLHEANHEKYGKAKGRGRPSSKLHSSNNPDDEEQ